MYVPHSDILADMHAQLTIRPAPRACNVEREHTAWGNCSAVDSVPCAEMRAINFDGHGARGGVVT